MHKQQPEKKASCVRDYQMKGCDKDREDKDYYGEF